MTEHDHLHCSRDDSPLRYLATELGRSVREICHQYWDRSSLDTSGLRQLYRASTSVGANIREAYHAESVKDRVHKLKIAEKEVGEVFFWIGLLTRNPPLLSDAVASEVADTARQIRALLISTIRTLRKQANG